MIDALVDKIQRWCDALPNATAEEVANILKREKMILHGEEELANDRPIIGSKFLIQDTLRTKTSPDGHFEAHFVTAVPFMDGADRKWKIQKGRPSDDLELAG